MITQPHSPNDLPDDIGELVCQAQGWKQRLTTEYGPSRNMQPEIALYADDMTYLGDVEFPFSLNQYDMMSVGLALCGLVMAFDVRYLMFTTEALMTALPDYDELSREDGTIRAPDLTSLSKRLHPSSGDTTQAWLDGDDSIVQTLLVCIADTKMGRTWSVTLPFSYQLGNKVHWEPLVADANQGPDYRSLVWGSILLPSVIRSQYDYVRIRPGANEAVEFLFANGMTMSVAEDTPLMEALNESGTYMVPMDEIDAVRQEHEELISRELADLPDAPPEEWFTE